MSVLRPSIASLNSLAKVLRKAQPVYTECRSILNYLDPDEDKQPPLVTEEDGSGSDRVPASTMAVQRRANVINAPYRTVRN